MTVNINFPVFVVYVMTFIGWFFLCFFFPTGLWAFPFDLIGQWAKRPKLMSEETFNREKAGLASKVAQLLTMGKKLVEDKKKVSKEKGACQRFAKRRSLLSE